MEIRDASILLNNSTEKMARLEPLQNLVSHYRELATRAKDPIEAEVAKRQLAALERVLRHQAISDNPHARDNTSPNTPSKSKWTHVSLTEVFRLAGNRLYPRANGTFDCGHEPCHGSKSGRCVTINVANGRWFCRSCRRGGDAVAAVQSLFGLDYRGAVKWLTERFGPPKTNYPPSKISYPKRPTIIREVYYEART
jgi:hypothetical protein